MLLFCILPIHGESLVYDKVLRLHVLANSDSETDQSLKLKVRDAVLEYVSPYLASVDSRDEAAHVVSERREEIERVASDTLAKDGCNDPVTLEVCTERYPVRNYESFCFPAGDYLSVRIRIGEAAGKNWWCVLFPKLCTAAAASNEEEFIAVGFTPDQYKIITESENASYKIRFRLLEYFKELGEPR
jgi:stage II sporulation protein R